MRPPLFAAFVCSLAFATSGCGNGGGSTGPTETPDPVPCLIANTSCWQTVPVGQALRLPVYRTHPILEGDTTVVRAVVVVHGADRNPGPYFDRMVEAVRLAGLTESTLVISPHFQTEADGPGQSEPAWTSGGWKRGHKSVAYPGVNERISSYEAVDDVLEYVSDRSLFPRVKSVVVTGHSAGGQYAHRFAATSPSENRHSHLDFRYVVVNPSTYLYLGPERASPAGGFEVLDREACETYNEWHYGLEGRNSYASALTEVEIQARLVSRDVVYMVGSADTGEAALDMTCGAMLQGQHRYVRGLILFEYMNAQFPESDHELHIVDGVGHSSTQMYQSVQGRQVLFEWGTELH